jgi:hypothetical protein
VTRCLWRTGVITAVTGLIAAAPALAATRTAVAQAGGITATLIYHTTATLPVPDTLSIARQGQTVYSAPVRALLCGTDCNVAAPRSSLHIVSLDPSTGPQVVLDLYSGGAHCCSIAQVFSWNGSTYTLAQRNFGDPGDRIVALHGQRLFQTADDRFAYAFTDFAASGLPIEFLAFRGGRFVDVTRRFPAQIARDAQMYWRAFRSQSASHWQDTVGVIAAWAADEDELGKSAYVTRVLDQQAHLGHLNSALHQAGGMRFVGLLQRFLRRTGYLR